MGPKRIGVFIEGSRVVEVQTAIERAEQLGIQGAWMPNGGAQLDNITTFAAAAARTRSIMLGTSIVQMYPRHPLVMAQQAQVVAQLAPGRFRLGIGPSHRPEMRPMGINITHPLGHLREYLRILKGLLQQGKVDFDGEFYQAHETIPGPLDVPIMASALRRGSFELCGAEADGVITWVCPKEYLRDVALPAMTKGAEEAGRPVPPLIAHAPVCVHENAEEVYAAYREQYEVYPTLPFYRRMLVDAGHPEASAGVWSDAMIENLVIFGDESRVADRLAELLSIGATELLLSLVLAGANQPASLDRTLRLVGKVAQSLV